jgi:hypothetical protein
MALQFVTKPSLSRFNEATGQVNRDGTKAALLYLPYDISFLAGWSGVYVAEEVAVKTYGQMVMCRTGIFVGVVGWMDSLPVGNTDIDIEKNGTSIFSTKPMFAQTNYLSLNIGSGSNEYTFSTTSFAPGSRITFKVTTVGSVNMPGSGMRVILKCKV